MQEKSKVMSHLNSPHVSASEKNIHAAREDFEQIFVTYSTELLRLSLQLTADARKAEHCLRLAMSECLSWRSIVRDRTQAWARRMVLRHAIRLTWGITNDILCKRDFEFPLQPSRCGLEALRESTAILELPVLDRLAFVICVLERYSILDCALLLRQTPQVVQTAIVRATKQLLAEEPRVRDSATRSESHIPTPTENFFECTCGTLLDHDCP